MTERTPLPSYVDEIDRHFAVHQQEILQSIHAMELREGNHSPVMTMGGSAREVVELQQINNGDDRVLAPPHESSGPAMIAMAGDSIQEIERAGVRERRISALSPSPASCGGLEGTLDSPNERLVRQNYKVPRWLLDMPCPYQYDQIMHGRHGIINYSCCGPEEGQIVLTFHGLNGTRATFEDCGNALKEFNYRVIAFDLYGHGLSASPPYKFFSNNYGVEFFVGQTEDLLKHLGIPEDRQLFLVGFSMGCVIAAAYAAKYPNQIKKMALISPAGTLTNKPLPLRIAQACRCFIPCLPCCVCRCCFHKEKFMKKFPEEDVENGTAEMLWQRMTWQLFVKKGVIQAFLGCVLRMPLWSAEDIYRKAGSTGAPVLIIWGDYDVIAPVKYSEKCLRCFKNAQLIRFKKSTHLVLADQPRATLACLLTFLDFPNDCDLALFRYLLPFSPSGTYVPRANRKPEHLTLFEYLEIICYRPIHWVRLPKKRRQRDVGASSFDEQSTAIEDHRRQHEVANPCHSAPGQLSQLAESSNEFVSQGASSALESSSTSESLESQHARCRAESERVPIAPVFSSVVYSQQTPECVSLLSVAIATTTDERMISYDDESSASSSPHQTDVGLPSLLDKDTPIPLQSLVRSLAVPNTGEVHYALSKMSTARGPGTLISHSYSGKSNSPG